MNISFEELEKQARALSPEEKATLVHVLLRELDATADPDAEGLWLKEAERRYHAYVSGELAALPGDEVMKRARARLK